MRKFITKACLGPLKMNYSVDEKQKDIELPVI